MTAPIIDRKTFLGATVAVYADFALGGCGGKSVLVESDDTGGTDTGGTETGGTESGGTTTGGTTGAVATGGTERGGSATGGTTGGTARGGATTGGTATGGTGRGGTGTGGATGGVSTGGVSTGGVSTGGVSIGGGSSSYACRTATSNGNHSHPLTIPWSDVERGYQDAPYVLEDGGTGHTHSLELAVYEFAYLSGGTTVSVVSSSNQGHTHQCEISCGPG